MSLIKSNLVCLIIMLFDMKDTILLTLFISKLKFNKKS